ncbi:MAG: M20/M25/M40 family metallo-hydrolase [Planctomycetota bacterium]|jgi:endoglucanase
MPTAKQQADHRRWLVELTGIPTAAGREDRVIDWVTDWVQRRRNVRMRRDATGNLVITRTGKPPVHPVFITAHIDHPAFVVRKVIDNRSLELEFRGGVFDPYFESAAIEVFDADGNAHRAVITKLDTKAKALKRVIARLSRAAPVAAGDIARWAFKGRGRKPTIHQGRLYAPACDDLAGVAAALSAFDVLRNRRDGASFGVLLTRAEEIGFIGAIAACKNHTITKRARLICLENSRSFAESPIGDGPILRVGDRLSVFSPQLTNRICHLVDEYQKTHPRLKVQRKLMPGGACEATAFGAYGYEATCICLPLGNYHNMADIDGVQAGKRPARVAPEIISVDDYHGMVEVLVHVAPRLDEPWACHLETRLDRLYRERGRLLRA